MNKRAKIITEQALALPAAEREELLIALAVSLGRHPYGEAEAAKDELSEEAKRYVKDAWDKGIASGPGRHGGIEDIIAEARRRIVSGRA